MKTNKSYTKRLKITKTGKIIARRPGKNHFNARASRSQQLIGKRSNELTLTSKEKARFLPGLIK